MTDSALSISLWLAPQKQQLTKEMGQTPQDSPQMSH